MIFYEFDFIVGFFFVMFFVFHHPSFYSCITNSVGVASYTFSNVASDLSITASYSNVSDTCTVTVQTYLFYDDCSSASGLTNYSNIRLLENGGSTTLSLEYNSTENAYKWTCRSGKAVILGIDALDGVTSDFRLTCQLKKTTSSHFIGLGYAQTELTGFGYGSDGSRWKGHGYSNGSYTGGINETGSSSANTWYCIELIKQGTSITINCYDSSKTTLYASASKTYSDNDNYFGFMSFNNGGVFYIKNIIAEPI